MKPFLLDNIFSLLGGFIIAQYLIPLSKATIQYIRDNKGFLGKIYQKYYNILGKRLYLYKKLHPALSNRKYEYKIYVENKKASCYCSEITEMRQDLFNIVRGKINRIGTDEKYETYFEGEINEVYFNWRETLNQNNEKSTIHSLYNLDGNPVNITGISLEINNRAVTAPIVILSRETNMYNTVEQLISDTPELKQKFKNIDTSSQIII